MRVKTSAQMYNSALQEYLIDDATLAQLKACNIKLLELLHDICTRENIPYSLAYGTMLGSVRHKGYIPWDDDIDVIMLRADYEKFCKIIAEEYSQDYYIHSRDTDKTSPLYFGKLIKKNTVLVEAQSMREDKKTGVYLDIFILDYLPKNKISRAIKSKCFKLFSRLASLSCDFRYPSPIIMLKAKDDKELAKYYSMRRRYGFFASILPIRAWTSLARRAVMHKKPTDALWTGIDLKPISVEMYENKTLYDFENRQFYGVKDYDSYLQLQYGKNYMQLPPEDKRERHIIIELKLED